MISKNSSEAEVINTLQAFCGRTQVGTDQLGRPIYETVDQTEFIAPVLQIFSYCANNGKKAVVQWLVTEFVPLQVSYDNNYCFFECLKWSHNDIAEMIVNHESFEPTMQVLENLLSRSKYANFRTCMNSPRLSGEIRTYRFTFMRYIDNNQFSNVCELLRKIRQRESDQNIQIDDQILPDPRFAKLQQVAPIVQPSDMVVELVAGSGNNNQIVVDMDNCMDDGVEVRDEDVVVEHATQSTEINNNEITMEVLDNSVVELAGQSNEMDNSDIILEETVQSIGEDEFKSGLRQRTKHTTVDEQ
jgi:hypothetical protein